MNDDRDERAELIMDSALVPAPLGNYDAGLDPYNNAVVYFFSFFGLLIFVMGFIGIGIALYRIRRHRSHAVRGLIVASASTIVGVGVAIAAAGAV